MMSFRKQIIVGAILLITSCKINEQHPPKNVAHEVINEKEIIIKGRWRHLSTTFENTKIMYNQGVSVEFFNDEITVIDSNKDSIIYSWRVQEDTLLISTLQFKKGGFFNSDTVLTISKKNQRIELNSVFNNTVFEFFRIE